MLLNQESQTLYYHKYNCITRQYLGEVKQEEVMASQWILLLQKECTVYTWNISCYVNFMDFAVSRAALKIYSVKILPSHIIYEYVTCKCVV